jgi:hypothetical protein
MKYYPQKVESLTTECSVVLSKSLGYGVSKIPERLDILEFRNYA